MGRPIAWQYEGKDFTEEMVGNYTGYVYLIENLVNNKKYIGKKLFWSAKIKKIKGKRKRYKVPSDWQTYWSSSAKLVEDVLQLGMENFTRTILHLCESKGECTYLELREQIDRRVLESDNFYNEWIMVRVRKSHLKF